VPAATVKMTKHMTPRELNTMTVQGRESVQGGGGGRGDAETAKEMGCSERGHFCMRVAGRELASLLLLRGSQANLSHYWSQLDRDPMGTAILPT
jgi:hypothetical protein